MSDQVHLISVDNLKEHCNPFNGCWHDLLNPIKKSEVRKCISNGTQILTDTSFSVLGPYPKNHRQRHIQKIAWFVVNGWTEPIHIDVGIPELGARNSYIVDDGNHRFAAAIYRKDKEIRSYISGSIGYAKSIKLWNPQA